MLSDGTMETGSAGRLSDEGLLMMEIADLAVDS